MSTCRPSKQNVEVYYFDWFNQKLIISFFNTFKKWYDYPQDKTHIGSIKLDYIIYWLLSVTELCFPALSYKPTDLYVKFTSSLVNILLSDVCLSLDCTDQSMANKQNTKELYK